MNNLTLRDPKTYQIIGAAMEVHRQLGCGFLEGVYQEALALELRDREIPFRRELLFPVSYKGYRLILDFSVQTLCPLCLCGVVLLGMSSTTETQRTQSLHREETRSLQQRRFVLG